MQSIWIGRGAVWVLAFVAVAQESTLPRYAEIFEEIARLDESNRDVEALRLFESLYAQEIPVDAFYQTLEARRAEILSEIMASDHLEMNGMSVRHVNMMFTQVLARDCRSYAYQVDISHHVSLEHLLHFQITHADILSALGSQRASNKQAAAIARLVESPDPWIVATTLFLFGHAERGLISPQSIADRWSDRPDLWNPLCTDQALLALASHGMESLTSIRETKPDIRDELDRLKPVAPTQAFVEIIPRGHLDLSVPSWSPKATLKTLVEKKGNHGTVKRWSGDTNHANPFQVVAEKEVPSLTVLDVEPGDFKASVRMSMCWGDTIPFKVKPGTYLRVQVIYTCGV